MRKGELVETSSLFFHVYAPIGAHHKSYSCRIYLLEHYYQQGAACISRKCSLCGGAFFSVIEIIILLEWTNWTSFPVLSSKLVFNFCLRLCCFFAIFIEYHSFYAYVIFFFFCYKLLFSSRYFISIGEYWASFRKYFQ